MRILGIETHYMTPSGLIRLSAVDWWRVTNPLNHLRKNTDWTIDIIQKVVTRKGTDEKAWERVGQNYNLIWSSYSENPKGYAYLKATNAMYGTKYNMDMDDNIFEVDDMNPAYIQYHPGSENLEKATLIATDADSVTVTTPHLRDVLLKVRNGKKVGLLPNYIDPDVYHFDPNRVPQHPDEIWIGYQGSATHYTDLLKTGVMYAIQRLMMIYPKLHFSVIGTPFDELANYVPANRLHMQGGYSNHLEWRKFWQEMPFDIGIAPLVDTSFNQSKSNIKWQEYSLRFIPGVYSDVEPYRDSIVEGETGFLASDEEEWFEKLSWLIENEILRKKISHQAQNKVMTHWTIQNNWEKYKKYIEEL